MCSRSIRNVDLLDPRATTAVAARWTAFFSLLGVFVTRTLWHIQGFHLIIFALTVFLLNQAQIFWSPFNKLAPDCIEVGLSYQHQRPLRLREFKLWLSSTQALLASMFLTYFPLFDISVSGWPLLTYFAILVPWVVVESMQQRGCMVEVQENGHDSVALWTALATLVVGTVLFDTVYESPYIPLNVPIRERLFFLTAWWLVCFVPTIACTGYLLAVERNQVNYRPDQMKSACKGWKLEDTQVNVKVRLLGETVEEVGSTENVRCATRQNLKSSVADPLLEVIIV